MEHVHRYVNCCKFTKFIPFIIDEWAKRETQALNLFEQKDRGDEEIQNHSIVGQFIGPVEEALQNSIGFPIKLIQLRNISSERHQVAHANFKHPDEQRTFLDE